RIADESAENRRTRKLVFNVFETATEHLGRRQFDARLVELRGAAGKLRIGHARGKRTGEKRAGKSRRTFEHAPLCELSCGLAAGAGCAGHDCFLNEATGTEIAHRVCRGLGRALDEMARKRGRLM